jgi:hypothetical protein
VIEYAKTNKSKVEAAEEVIQVIRQLPDRTYSNMADLQKALAKVR